MYSQIGKFTLSPTLVEEENLGVIILRNTYSTWQVRQGTLDASRRRHRRSLGSALDLDLDLSNDQSMRSMR